MRVLVDEVTGRPGRALDDLVPAGALDPGPDAALAAAYAVPRLPWLRVNMVATLDGAATGADGRTGSINNAADKRVFDLLRSSADAVLVGAGTARSEGYGPVDVPIVLVSRTGRVPSRLRHPPPGRVLLGTTRTAPGLAEARESLGAENVLLAGHDEVDLAALLQQLHARGLQRITGEGGPTLLRELLAAGLVDELCLTTVPRLVAGDHVRVTTGAPIDAPLELRLLLEHEGTLLARWFVTR